MNNKTKGAIAGIAGIALLAGGTTFALWNDSANLNGGTITAGNLDVAPLPRRQAPASGWTFRRPHGQQATTIDLDSFKIVPGDTIEGTFGIDAALQGENLVANLGLSRQPARPPASSWQPPRRRV